MPSQISEEQDKDKEQPNDVNERKSMKIEEVKKLAKENLLENRDFNI